MSEYTCLNDVNITKELELSYLWKSVQDEWKELRNTKNPWEMFLEFFDVLHSLIKYCISRFISRNITKYMITWIPIFFLVLPCGIKHGYRYAIHGCIRNHKNKGNVNHVCNFNI